MPEVKQTVVEMSFNANCFSKSQQSMILSLAYLLIDMHLDYRYNVAISTFRTLLWRIR